MGLRGIRKCLCDNNLLWGVTSTDRWTLAELKRNPDFKPFQFPQAIRVRAKIAPYNAAYGTTAAGEVPESWSDGPEYTLDRPIGQISDSLSSRIYLGSRVVYEDGKQKFVNYVMSTNTNWMNEITWWSRIHIDDPATTDTFFLGTVESFLDPTGHTLTSARMIGDIIPGSNQDIISPQQWYAGYRYFVFSDHEHGDSQWRTHKWDNDTSSWTTASATGFDGAAYAVVQPTHRAYLRSNAPQPDEPWVMAVKRSIDTWVTGRWLNTDLGTTGNDHHLEASEVENIIWEDVSATVDLVRYNRIGERDLAIFKDDVSGEHWMYDGSNIVPIDDEPTYITADKEGNIVYGAGSIFEGQAFIKKLDADNNELWTQTPASPGGVGPHPDMFQIICNDTWIMVHGLEAGEDFATSTLAGIYKGLPYLYDKLYAGEPEENNILSWSLSYDGTIRIPHVQMIQPLPRDTIPDIDPISPWPVEANPKYRINGREYQSDDQSYWESQFDLNESSDRAWNLRGSAVQNQPGDDSQLGTLDWNPLAWGFLPTTSESTDYDIVDLPCCGCKKAVNY